MIPSKRYPGMYRPEPKPRPRGLITMSCKDRVKRAPDYPSREPSTCRCGRNPEFTGLWYKYGDTCRDCARDLSKAPEHIPDEQIPKYVKIKDDKRYGKT